MTTGFLSEIPLIDLGPYFSGDPAAKRRVAGEINRACEGIGFFLVSGHGVDPALCESIRRESRAVLCPAAGGKARHQAAGGRLGKPGLRAGRHGAAVGDDRRGDAAARPQGSPSRWGAEVPDHPSCHTEAAAPHFAPNMWPSRPAGLRPAYEAYIRALGSAGAASAPARVDRPRSARGPFRGQARQGFNLFRVLNYPEQMKEPEEGQLRAGRAFGLRLSHNLPDRRQAGRLASAQPGRHVGGRAGCRRLVRGQYRRYGDALDERPLGGPLGIVWSTRHWRPGSASPPAFHHAQPRRGDRVSADLPGPRASGEIPADRRRRLHEREVREPDIPQRVERRRPPQVRHRRHRVALQPLSASFRNRFPIETAIELRGRYAVDAA